jgi:ornithine cyclodeaminase/alanine dehydrogenase-like protein (mu-crystallin family)
MIDAVVVVMDAATGVVRALMDGRRITALRTAATSAIAVRLLAPGAGGTLTLIGTGVQSTAHAETLTRVRSFERVLVVSASGCRDRAIAAAERIRLQTGAAATAVDIDEGVSAADVIVMATIAKAPLVTTGSVKGEPLLISVGCFQPGATEFDVALAEAAGLVVADDADRLRATWQATRVWFPGRAVDLADLLSGSAPPTTAGLRLFLSDGRAFQDLAAAVLVLEAAERAGFSGQALSGTLPVPGWPGQS